MIKLSFVGDFFPGGVIIDQDDICSAEVISFLQEVDIRVATLESAIGEGYEFDEEKMSNPMWRNIIHSPNRGIDKLKQLNINVVTLANNHIYDLGSKGLLNVISLLDNLGILHCRAGINAAEASKPAVLECNGKTLAFLGYMVHFKGWRAPHPATNFTSGLNIFDLEKAILDVKKAKSQYDYVFVLPHWGDEYSVWPVPKDVYYAKNLIMAGADGVFGSHTHQVQPIVEIAGKPVFFSLGNFIFPDFYMDTNRTTWYPQKNSELANIPMTYEYERNPTQRLLRVWPDNNRKGIIGLVKVGEQINYEHRLVIMNRSNKLVFLQDAKIERKLGILSKILKTPFYSFIYKCKSKRKISLFISRVLKKLV